VSAARLFSDDALAALAEPPAIGIRVLLEAGEVGAAESAVVSADRAWRDSVSGYHGWVASTIRHVLERDVADTPPLMTAIADFYAHYPGDARVFADPPTVTADDVIERVRAGDTDGALAAFAARGDGWRARNDVGRDLVSALLSFVYRRHGVDELEAALRRGGNDTLVAWMDTDISRPPEKRLVSTTRMLHGHFTEFRLSEDDEKFIIHQDVCGTCARQIADGRYAPPLDLAVVAERHLVTGGRGGTPIYRAHVPVMHVAMPRERIGVPWPLPLCPAGLETGVCDSYLYKDPYNPRANAAADGDHGWITDPG
jgi:hypothetical protein